MKHNSYRILCLLLAIVCCACRLYAFRFALLTDVHISRTNPVPMEDLQASVSEINAMDSIAFVIVSGDITEAGDKGSMLRAKEQFDRLDVPYYVTSGNHETKWSESGCTDFARVFGDDKFAFRYDDCFFVGFNSGPVIKMADGHVAPQDLIWLKEQLQKQPEGTLIVPVTHYPLQSGDVDNWYQVTDILRQYPVQTVLGGHYHRNMLLNCDGLPDVLCRSNLRAKQPVGGWSLIQVDSDSIRFYEKRIGQAPLHWLSLPSGNRKYGCPDLSLRPDTSINALYPQVSTMWQTGIKVGIYSAPAVSDGFVYVGDDEGKFYCLSVAGGTVCWTYATQGRIISTAAVAEHKVVFGSTDGNIYCLDALKGGLCWKFSTGAAVMGCPVISGDTVFIGGSDGCFRALRLRDGHELWSFCELQGYVETKPCLYNGNIYFGAWDCNLYALRCADGHLLWKWNNGRPNDKFSPAAVWPVATAGKVFITAPDRFLTALDAQTGNVVWRTAAHKVRETIGLSHDGKTLFSRCMNDSVLAMDAQADAPVLLWKTDAHYGYDHNPSMLMENNGIVVFGTKNGLLHAVDASTGQVLWRHKIGNSVINTVTILSDKDIVVTSSEGTVTRLLIDDMATKQ